MRMIAAQEKLLKVAPDSQTRMSSVSESALPTAPFAYGIVPVVRKESKFG